MNLLILGGTVYLGRYLVEAALARGHQVTLFNRGKSNVDLFPDVEKLRGERGGDLSVLRGRRWDAVIDTCGYIPRHVRESAQLLANAVDHYTFISSISVYSDVSTPGVDEDSPVALLKEGANTEEVNGETYGALKALCEQEAEKAMPGRTLSLRAGLIVGPHDYTGRFPYWVRRVAQGGEVLAPGRPERQVQLIDVRDLAEWTIRMAESHRAGVFNATGPVFPLTMSHMLETCKAVSGSDAALVWVSEAFLSEQEVSPWEQMPLWLPEGQDTDGMMAVNVTKAFAAGLTFRPLADTVRDTHAWIDNPSDGGTRAKRLIEIAAGITRERERELLDKWHSQVRA